MCIRARRRKASPKLFPRAALTFHSHRFGIIVIEVGNRGGNPNRDRWYETFGYNNLRDYGLADKKTAAEQLADAASLY